MMSSSSMLTKSIADMDNSLNVSDTLEQATKALAAHRAWMQKRTHVHNAVVPAPFSGPPSSEDAAAAATKKPKPLDWAVASSSLPKGKSTECVVIDSSCFILHNILQLLPLLELHTWKGQS